MDASGVHGREIEIRGVKHSKNSAVWSTDTGQEQECLS